MGDWTREFDEPVPLPEGGRPLRTLRDAAAYIEALPTTEQQHDAVQTALHVLLQAADHGGPMMFARIGVSRMVRRHHPEPLRKDKPWGRRRLKRDE
ncbi:hypothetical protein [Rhodopseudomonas palustris]|uniref:hypothetical protein n=1 Tax=Rhodopseudomonas palustris TaxID=1076 RepID=UPI0021F34A5F|nr:hypothetical protein [Rhodopseudomonas palustris]UYO55174.1 hypothetical protein KQX61_07155 [Rhodopseudomonas palustris]